MKKDMRLFHRKVTCEKLLRIWNKMPELNLGEILSCCNDLEKLSDEQIIQNCVNKIRVYKEERRLKNKIKKGLKSCVTKMTLW